MVCSGGINGVFIAYTHAYVQNVSLLPGDSSCVTTYHTFPFSWTTRQYSQR